MSSTSSTRPLGPVTRVATALVCAAVLGAGATPSAAAALPHSSPEMLHQLTTLCSAAGGDFFPARFGWRCQEARLDPSGEFTAVRAVCERAADRWFIQAVDHPVPGVGTWLCAPA